MWASTWRHQRKDVARPTLTPWPLISLNSLSCRWENGGTEPGKTHQTLSLWTVCLLKGPSLRARDGRAVSPESPREPWRTSVGASVPGVG